MRRGGSGRPAAGPRPRPPCQKASLPLQDEKPPDPDSRKRGRPDACRLNAPNAESRCRAAPSPFAHRGTRGRPRASQGTLGCWPGWPAWGLRLPRGPRAPCLGRCQHPRVHSAGAGTPTLPPRPRAAAILARMGHLASMTCSAVGTAVVTQVRFQATEETGKRHRQGRTAGPSCLCRGLDCGLRGGAPGSRPQGLVWKRVSALR